MSTYFLELLTALSAPICRSHTRAFEKRTAAAEHQALESLRYRERDVELCRERRQVGESVCDVEYEHRVWITIYSSMRGE
jgi:hypothetical protein